MTCLRVVSSLLLSVLVVQVQTQIVEAQQEQEQEQGCPLEVWAYESMESCVRRNPPAARGTIRTDGVCRQTDVFENPNSLGARLLPGTYAAECAADPESGEMNMVRFLHSGCLYDDCFIDPSRYQAQICDQDQSSLAVFYSRLAAPGLIPVTEMEFTEIGGRRCLGFTVQGQVVLAFAVYGSCNCNDVVDDLTTPTSTPTSTPTRRPTQAPSLRPTSRQTLAPTPTIVVTTRNPSQSPTPRPITSNPSPPSSPPRNTLAPTNQEDLENINQPTSAPTSRTPSSATDGSNNKGTLQPTSITIGLADFTEAPHVDPNADHMDESMQGNNNNNSNSNGIRSPNGQGTENLNDTNNATADSFMVIVSIAAATGGSLCFMALCLLMMRRRKSQKSPHDDDDHDAIDHEPNIAPIATRNTFLFHRRQSHGKAGNTTSANNNKNTNSDSPAPGGGTLREISVHEQRNEEVSTLGDPAGLLLGGGYGEESTADPVRIFDSARDDEGTVTSVYTSGTDIRVSKDDNSLEDTFTEFQPSGVYIMPEPTETGCMMSMPMAAAMMKQHIFHVEAPPGPLGLLMHSYDGRLRVNKIKENSIFASTGVRQGDYLNAVDNVMVKFITPAALASLVQARADASRLFTFEREEIMNDKNVYQDTSDDEEKNDTSTKIHC